MALESNPQGSSGYNAEGGTGHVHTYREPTASDKVFVFSDSTLAGTLTGLHAAGDSQESRTPEYTLRAQAAFIKRNPEALKGATVFLSSVSNNTSDFASVARSIELAHEAGAAQIVVVGAGDRSDLAATNARAKPLVEGAKDAKGNLIGAEFEPLGPNNGIHSTDVAGLTARLRDIAGKAHDQVASADPAVRSDPSPEAAVAPQEKADAPNEGMVPKYHHHQQHHMLRHHHHIPHHRHETKSHDDHRRHFHRWHHVAAAEAPVVNAAKVETRKPVAMAGNFATPGMTG